MPTFRTIRDRRPARGAAAEPDGSRTTSEFDRSWWSWAGPHGGLLAALTLDAAGDVVAADRVPQTVSTQFFTPAGEGEIVLDARVLRAGGSSDVVRVDVFSGETAVLTSTVTLARPRSGGTTYDAVPAPAAPPPDECPVVSPPVELVPFAQHVEIRAASPGPLQGGDRAELVAWIRWADAGAPVDRAALVVFLDALAPALYGIATVPVPVPTVDFTATLGGAAPSGKPTAENPRAGDPPSGDGSGEGGQRWLLVRIATRSAADGWCVDDSDVWSGGGTLLGQARQTRRVLGDVRGGTG